MTAYQATRPNHGKVKQFLFRQKYRFDIGAGFVTLVTIPLMTISASDKLSMVVNLSIKEWIALIFPATVFGVWFFGYIMDRWKAIECWNVEYNNRNETVQLIVDALARQEKELAGLRKELSDLKK